MRLCFSRDPVASALSARARANKFSIRSAFSIQQAAGARRVIAGPTVEPKPRLCPVALLVLLPAAARARVVAPDLVVHDPLLHGHGARARRGAAALAASGGHVA